MLTCSDQLKSPNRYNLQIKKNVFQSVFVTVVRIGCTYSLNKNLENYIFTYSCSCLVKFCLIFNTYQYE